MHRAIDPQRLGEQLVDGVRRALVGAHLVADFGVEL